MILMRRVRVLSLPVLAALPPGGARAACNTTGTDVCCERTETLEIGGVEWPEADGVEASRTCSSSAFELTGLRPGRLWGTNVTSWASADPETVCPPALRAPFEEEIEPDVVWEMSVGGTNVPDGSGPPTRSEARLLPCDLRLLTAGGVAVPDEEEWCGGAFVPVGAGIVLLTGVPAGLSFEESK